MSKKICKTCSFRYHDDFCMVNCLYVNDKHTCKRWTNQPMQFNYHVIYRLCKDYINLCEDYKERERLKEEYPDYQRDLKLIDGSYEFFFNCCLNDLHREMSLWKTRR